MLTIIVGMLRDLMTAAKTIQNGVLPPSKES